ncbi:N-acetylglucosamine-6-phosphate deacetylase [Salinibacterium sp. M195]|uniref:N-acetylglucosamine-6-phosphate deacetylase n=1 Tax=Salinibacterium sp. M195 TaxID=2583374 RepID=UPI001C631B14|nr:N-acetylglucosamine-6-phosphate deacetylase [Salinibacterium sp. M195]QYH35475.1 N-acetylglucosamine-6-phosphate deacetylase [Salinibacterium sp. M195]
MNDHVIHSAQLVTGSEIVDDGWVAWQSDTIVATGTGEEWRTHTTPATTVTNAAGSFLSAGFVDIHCHGGNGAAFDDGPEAIRAALSAHRAKGTTRSVISLVSGDHASLVRSLSTIAELAATDPLVLGSHLEGPFLQHNFKGAHNPDALRNPTAREIDELLTAANGTLRQITIAPELDGAMEAIAQLSAAGVTVAIGHTSANYDQTLAAIDAGARLLTHTFNAMHGIHHREPGPITAAISREPVILEVINDGVHVHPDVVKMLFASAPGRVALVTDAMAAACSHDGNYRLGSLDVTVTDGVARLSDGGSIAGSTLTMDAAVRRAVTEVGLTLPQAAAAASAVPARAIGRSGDLGTLAAGFAADAVLLDADLKVLAVWAAGRALPQPERSDA